MVQSILNDLKNQTRRTKGLEYFNINPNRWRYDGQAQLDPLVPVDKNYHWFEFIDKDGKELEAYQKVKCPYGQVGDVLWVRESFAKDVDSYLHRASHALVDKFIKWKPSIHMPKEAARIFLEITNIRIERLQDISRGDCMGEGCPFQNIAKVTNPKHWFEILWQSINGESSWNSNPWVWVIEFKQIEKPQNFI